jgi:hypothetical protein
MLAYRLVQIVNSPSCFALDAVLHPTQAVSSIDQAFSEHKPNPQSSEKYTTVLSPIHSPD